MLVSVIKTKFNEAAVASNEWHDVIWMLFHVYRVNFHDHQEIAK